MSQRNLLRLIIDANVARSAGPMTATFPTSKNCRDFLMALEELNFVATSNAELREEWNKHQSNFFRTWRARMMGKKRLEILASTEDEELRDKLNACAADLDDPTCEGKIWEVMEKDCHLLELALQTDQRIVSMEKNVRKRFAQACPRVAEVRNLLWVNPDASSEAPLTWLQDGAPDEVHRQLQHYLSET